MEFQRLELGAEIQDAILANIESVVVEENFLHLREIFDGLIYFARDVFGGAGAPGVAGNGLRPHAEGAKRRAAARGIERNVRIQEKWNVVAFDLQVALVNVGSERKRIQLRGMQLRARRVVNDLAVFAIADAQNFAEWVCLARIPPRSDRTHRA